MNNSKLQIKIKQRSNKLDSKDYDNFEPWMIEEAFNKAQIEWVRRQLHGGNSYREGAEQSTRRVDDLAQLLTPYPLKGTSNNTYFESQTLPKDYFQFNKVVLKGTTDKCKAQAIKVFEAEEANVEVYLADENYKPSFLWRETFCTIVTDRIRIYTNDEFTVQEASLLYYRLPKPVQFSGSVDLDTGLIHSSNQISEFRDGITELIVDIAASILTGDIETIQTQRLSANAEQNN